MRIVVDSYVGLRGLQMPRKILFGQNQVAVVEVIDQWYGTDYRYIKVRGDDQGLYVLHVHDAHQDWKLVMFTSVRGQVLAEHRYTQRA
jgi:hypothetical protein